MAEGKKKFLMDHREEIIQKIRNPIHLADALLGKRHIHNEMYKNIKKITTEQNQTREIFGYLNSTVQYDGFYDWLMENESDMFEELGKRAKLKNVDETDNKITKRPDLKMISTFPKLEHWVSDPNINQKLLCGLERKLTGGSMEVLKKELKEQEPKNSLCFNADNIDEIRKNKELDTFLNTTKDAKFPKITLKMFFKKCRKAQSSTDHKKNVDKIDVQDIHTDEIEEQSQRSDLSRHKDVSPSEHQNELFTKNETLLEDGPGRTDMQDAHIRETDEEPQRSCGPNGSRYDDGFLKKNEPFTKKETPIEDGLGGTDMRDTHIRETDEEPQRSYGPNLRQNESERCGNMIMQQNVQKQMEVDPEHFYSKQLPESNIGSVEDYTQISSTENLAKYTDTTTLTTNKNIEDQLKATQRREKSKYLKKKKKEEKDNLLHDWALKQCDGSKEELRKIFDQISIINMVEHSDKPCFIAENVMVYKDSTPESQIIFIANDNTSTSTKTLVHYQMFVCNIKKAIILGPKKPTEHQIEYDETKVPIDKCTRFVFEAFAPILAMFKMIQKEENLYFLV
ncbi:uncharacterized protein LOC113656727 isoform X2 [Tachysurus fulvidraco]|uniref:uncharacterized protein LOC113656727 isoform X2 n=1 Tax=Tachysurus fulvidraco TaxID=1234273 RepID=UPI001FEF90C8|nr:uncharacterized protein LOC113656727 isoform X2 [Tachysurus fulvidraco]